MMKRVRSDRQAIEKMAPDDSASPSLCWLLWTPNDGWVVPDQTDRRWVIFDFSDPKREGAGS